MKTKELKELYFPKSISIHVKYLFFCAIFTPLWGLFIKVELNSVFFIGTFSMMFLNMEILGFLSKKIFIIKSVYTRKAITLVFLIRLLFFLIIALVVCLALFVLFLIVFYQTKGWGFPGILTIVNEIAVVIKVAILGLLFCTPIFFFAAWQDSLKREFELREENLIFQNETLRNQVNPHFLFNSLNTLLSLVNSNAENVEQFIIKLSSIYRYITENSPKDKVPLSLEVAFIKDFFYLHKIRDEEKIQLDLNIQDADKFEIMPVSLQLLIENALKHNMATRERPLRIAVYVEDTYIVVKNNLQKMATKPISSGKGLKNLSERVRLITQKALITEETPNEYTAKIPLIQ